MLLKIDLIITPFIVERYRFFINVKKEHFVEFKALGIRIR
jgi:hypothetical protein